MSPAFDYDLLDDPDADCPVMGISEWHNWYNPPDRPPPTDAPLRAIDDCIDAHLARGVDHLVWNCGRSVVQYRSDLDRVTEQDSPRTDPAMNAGCPLRRALEYGGERDVEILGRLGMNRHHGPNTPGVASEFALTHPEYRERTRNGDQITHRLCYAIEEVREERLDVLLEIQRIGVDALVLDFCRQMPILGYHDALVEPYVEEFGDDPREIDSTQPAAYREWFQHRADVLTEFMRTLRGRVREQERELGAACPIVARVPDSPEWLSIAAGLDVERWCAEDLIDGTMLSPFSWAAEDRKRYPEYHAATAHEHGKFCIGGIGSLELIREAADDDDAIVEENSGFFHPAPVYEKADRQYGAGVDAMSLYQSEALVRMPYLEEPIGAIGDPETVAKRAAETDAPDSLSRYGTAASSIGLDWHARFVPPKCLMNGHSLAGRWARRCNDDPGEAAYTDPFGVSRGDVDDRRRSGRGRSDRTASSTLVALQSRIAECSVV